MSFVYDYRRWYTSSQNFETEIQIDVETLIDFDCRFAIFSELLNEINLFNFL